MAVYLTMFYTKRELALRIGKRWIETVQSTLTLTLLGYLFVSSAIAGACGGLLAFAIGHMDGVAGLRGWRWIMIIEGGYDPSIHNEKPLTKLRSTNICTRHIHMVLPRRLARNSLLSFG
jgi:hypothetical protein